LSVAEGNPLFAEQMISMLIDSGVIREQGGRWEFAGGSEDVAVPPNVSSLLASRLDRLIPLERNVVERAAVIGLEFETAAVAALAPDGDAGADLAPPLSALCGKRLIRAAGAGLRGEGYQFSHLLVRDAAYDRLLKRTRARMHESFADWLLEIATSRVAEFEEIIGYHLEQSFRYRSELGPVDAHARSLGDRAARHLGVAGARAIDRGDMPAAASMLQRAAVLLDEGHEEIGHACCSRPGRRSPTPGSWAPPRPRSTLRAMARRCSETTRSEERPSSRGCSSATPPTPRAHRKASSRACGSSSPCSRKPPTTTASHGPGGC
jgi:predicted ATPase